MKREPCTPKELGKPGPDEHDGEEMTITIDRSAGEVFGNSSIPPSFYICPQHKKILAQDVVWKQDGRACCPICDAALGKVE